MAYKDVTRVEVKSCDERIHRVEVGHPITYVLSKLHSFTNVDFHLCRDIICTCIVHVQLRILMYSLFYTTQV